VRINLLGGRARASGHRPRAGHGLLQLIPPARSGGSRRVYGLLPAAALLVSAFLFRTMLACGTSGSDVPQFLAFAETMDLCVYSSGHPAGQVWPYPWPYPYGPLLLPLLKLAYEIACPCTLEFYQEIGGPYRVVVDPRWACTLKVMYTIADLAVAAALYYALKGRRGLVAAGVYLYSPITVYVASVYGMFDPIPVALLVWGLILYDRGRRAAGGVLSGIAVGFKQTVVPPLLVASAAASPVFLLAWVSTAALPYAVVLTACPGDTGFLRDTLAVLGSPSFPRPVVYSMNGLMSAATILYDRGFEWAAAIPRMWPVLFAALLAPSLYASVRSRDPLLAAALGSAAFTASYWRVNPQYVVVPIALLLLAWPRLARWSRPAAAMAVAAASAWGLLYPQGFWGRVHMPLETWQARLLDRITFGPVSDTGYAIVELAFTLSLWALVWVEALWRRGTS